MSNKESKKRPDVSLLDFLLKAGKQMFPSVPEEELRKRIAGMTKLQQLETVVKISERTNIPVFVCLEHEVLYGKDDRCPKCTPLH